MNYILRAMAGPAAGKILLISLLVIAAAMAGLSARIWHLGVKLDAANNKVTEAELATERCVLSQKTAAAESKARGAETGAKALDNYTEKTNALRPAVDAAADRLVRQCAPRPTLSGGDLSVPSPSQATPEADARTGDAESDAAFAAAAGRDLRACAPALIQGQAILDFVCANGGCPND